MVDFIQRKPVKHRSPNICILNNKIQMFFKTITAKEEFTCLWKLSNRSALSSMVALVRRSPARDPGRFSSSWILWAMRACSLNTTGRSKP